ncbi:hypothetical protein C0991_010863, partial [Blastosporella zonata]
CHVTTNTATLPAQTRRAARHAASGDPPIAPETPAATPNTPPSLEIAVSDTESSSDHCPTFSARFRMMSKPKTAVVEFLSSKVPTLTPGDIEPLALANWEYGCQNFFATKNVLAANQVASTLIGLQDQRIINWLMTERTRVCLLTFAQFMTELRRCYIRKGWETKERTTVLSSRMTESSTFAEWTTDVLAHAALISGTTAALSDERLRHTFEAGMCEALRREYQRTENAATDAIDPTADNALFDWISAVTLIDDDRNYNEQTARRMAAELAVSHVPANLNTKRKASKSADNDRFVKRPFIPTSKPNSSASAVLSSSVKRPPPLTEVERALLKDNGGCNCCRRLFAGHETRNCPNNFPTMADYKEITPGMVAAAKGKNRNKSTVAAVMPTIEDTEDSATESDCSLSVSETDSFCIDHLFWDCLVESSTSLSPLRVTALIDNASHLVLIDQTLANKLSLRPFKLADPQHINLAMSSLGENAGILLTHYVKLSTLSCSRDWKSDPVHAIIAKNLCLPLILGLPWLQKNHVVINHFNQTVIDSRCNYILLKPSPYGSINSSKPYIEQRRGENWVDTKTRLAQLDAIGAMHHGNSLNNGFSEEIPASANIALTIRDRVETLAHYAFLKDRGEGIKSEFRDLFEPMPHVEELPSEVLCEIKLTEGNPDFKT